MKSSQIQQIAISSQSQLGKPDLSGLKFDNQPPSGGQSGKMIWVPYNKLDQVICATILRPAPIYGLRTMVMARPLPR